MEKGSLITVKRSQTTTRFGRLASREAAAKATRLEASFQHFVFVTPLQLTPGSKESMANHGECMGIQW